MPAAYTPTPCRRCGGEKAPRAYKTERPRYCKPCHVIVRREYWAANAPYWCGGCDLPRNCKRCAENKQARMKAAMAGRKARSDSNYFRPFNAERWWQHRSHQLVQQAIKKGLLPRLKDGGYACVDCGAEAMEYDHRDYGRPFDVDPVCRSCNKQRGTAIWPDEARFKFATLSAPKRQKARAA